MKRLTISMSDELFDKLDSIENKSLFIRKLIEREVDMLDSIQGIDSSIPWERDIAALKGNVDELFIKLSDIEKQLNTRVMQETPTETQSCPIQTNHDRQPGTMEIDNPGLSEPVTFGYEEPCLNPFDNANIECQQERSDEKEDIIPEPAQEDKYSFLIPEDKTIELQPEIPKRSEAEDTQDLPGAKPALESIDAKPLPELHSSNDTIHEPTMMIPELEPPVQTQQEQAFAMPEPELLVQTQQKQQFVIPEFEPSMGTQQEQTFVMPEPEPPAETQQKQQFVIPELEPPMGTQQEQTFVMPELKPPMETQQKQAFIMPELKPPVETQQKQAFIMPELKPPVETLQRQAFVIPELKPPVETQQEQTFVMQELKPSVDFTDSTQAPVTASNPPFEIAENEPFVMPELSAPEGAEQAPQFMSEVKPPFENTDHSFTMPDLKAPAETEGIGTFKIPELQPETAQTLKMEEQQRTPVMEKQPLFKIHNIESPKHEEKLPPFVAPAFDTQPENAQAPPFDIPVQKVNSSAQQPPISQPVKDTTIVAPARNSSSKPDKLGSNILMYMPHGAKVKKDIIKSLISKQFSENEIEAKISELVSAGVLKLAAENGNQYLIRS